MMWAKILLAVFYLIQRQNVFGQPHCCPENVTLTLNSNYTCENIEPPSIKCDKIPFRIPNSLYTIQNDTEGEYLEIDSAEIIVRSPYFCIGQHGHEGSVAIYCPTQLTNSTEALEEYEEFSSSEKILEYFSVTVRILDFLSTLFMGLMAAAWLLILPAGEIEEKSLFHLSLSSSSAHAFYFYNFVSSNGIFPQFCRIVLYLTLFFVLSTFMWFFLIIYYLWNRCKFGSNSFIVIQHYRIIGYGVPFLLIVSGIIHTYIREIVSSSDLDLGCSTFRKVLEEFYFQPFVIIIALSNMFLWCNLRRHLRNTIIITPENELLQLKINELLTLTGRLLIVLGLPWLVLFICDFTNEFTMFRYEFLLYISSFLDLATSGDGIFVSIAMVTSHRRLKLWVFQKIRYITRIRMQLFRKNVLKERQEISFNPTSGHLQMEPSAEERLC